MTRKNFFQSHLWMEHITDADYTLAKEVCKDFQIKNLGGCYNLYVQSDILLLSGVFEKFRNTCIKIYELDLVRFIIAAGLAWEEALKKTKVKSDLLTDIDMLLMAQKHFRGGISHAIHQYMNANNIDGKCPKSCP